MWKLNKGSNHKSIVSEVCDINWLTSLRPKVALWKIWQTGRDLTLKWQLPATQFATNLQSIQDSASDALFFFPHHFQISIFFTVCMIQFEHEVHVLCKSLSNKRRSQGVVRVKLSCPCSRPCSRPFWGPSRVFSTASSTAGSETAFDGRSQSPAIFWVPAEDLSRPSHCKLSVGVRL